MPIPPPSALRYRPLNAASNDVRILLLESGASIYGEIRCRIEHVPLVADSNYVAVSYCSGKTDTLVPARINGQKVYITSSLSGALTELRRRGYTRVWADVICINQADNAERSRQILRMADIYSSASAVMAWVGDADAHTIDALLDLSETLEELLHYNDRRDRYQSLGSPYKDDQDVLTTRAQYHDTKTIEGQALRQRGLRRIVCGVRNFTDDKPLQNPHPSRKTKMALQYIIENLGNSNWKPLAKLLGCDYWSQINIIQELSLAHRSTIIWGQQIFNFLDIAFLTTAYRIMRKANLVGNIIPLRACQHIQNLVGFKSRQGQLEGVPLVEAMQITCSTSSPDPRDKVFGLIGITTDGPEIFPAPTYSGDIDDLNEDATFRIVVLEKTLDYVVVRSQDPGTWPVDWFSTKAWSDPRIVSYLGRSSCFQLKGSIYTTWSATRTGPFSVTIRHSDLVIKGAIIDSIRSCSATYEERKSTCKPLPVYKPREIVPRGEVLDYNELGRQLFMCLYILCDERRKILSEADFYSAIQFALAKAMLGTGPRDPCDEMSRFILKWVNCSMNSSFTLGGSLLKDWLGAQPLTWPDGPSAKTYADAFIAVSSAKKTLQMGMRLGRTTRVRVGWFTKHARPGDFIALLDGCTVPAVLRRQHDGSYMVVGDCIIPSIMLGEANHHARSELRIC